MNKSGKGESKLIMIFRVGKIEYPLEKLIFILIQ